MKRVNFKRIEIQNFLSVGNVPVEIDITSGLNVITGINHDKEDSKNGVGKTTIADALFFCLFGTTIRDLKKEDIINNINKKKCSVKLNFEIEDVGEVKSYIIERKIAPNKLYLEEDGVDKTKSSMPKTTEKICKLIGASADVFRNAVIMTVNGTVPFMSQKKVEKRKFCEGLFTLGVFQDILLESRKMYNETKGEIAVEEAKNEEVSKTLDIYKGQKQKKDDYRISRTSKLLGREQDNLKELEKQEDGIEVVNLNDIKDFESNIKILEDKKSRVQNDARTFIRSIATKEEQKVQKASLINDLNSFGDMCEECKRPFTEDDKTSRNKKIKAIKDEIVDIEANIKEETAKQDKLDELKIKCSKAIDIQKNNIVELNNKVQYNESIKSRVKQLNTWNKQIKIDIEALEADKGEFDTLINDSTTRLNTLSTNLATLKKNLEILDVVKYIVSEEGVKSFIIKKMLKILNGKLAYYLNRLDAPCRFKFNEYFGEQIINERNEECSYENFSSGEKKRIDLAILFTFMDIRRLQGNTSVNIAFYDEILDTSLDDKGIELFLEIVKERVEKYDEACYIISHKSNAVKAATNDIIFLEKKNGFTTVGDIDEYEFIKEI